MARATLCAAALLCVPAAGAAPEVVVSIKPIHSLVAGVMGEVGEPRLIVPGAASPHTYQMRPSEAAALHAADLVVWVGEAVESFLADPIADLASDAEILTLNQDPGMMLLPNRSGGIWPEDAHDHDHGDHQAAGHDDHEDHQAAGHDDHGHHHAEHGEFDMHIWLDPHNARRTVDAVAASLARLGPEHAATYQRNAAAMRARIDTLEGSLRARLAPVGSHAFMVFHDGYQYFERAFGLHGAAGAITLGPARLPGAKRLASLRRALVERDVRCVFIEPQFEPRLAHSVVESTEVGIATIDLLGADLAAGPDAWFEILSRIGDNMAECLGDA